VAQPPVRGPERREGCPRAKGAANEGRRIVSARRRICRCSSVLLKRREAPKNISGPGGPRKSLKRLNLDKEIQGKPRYYGADATSGRAAGHPYSTGE
jgi:hypothetical protein